MKQYDIYWVTLDPTIGAEIKKTRPCIIISPDEMNYYLKTILIAPITSTIKNIPFRVKFYLDKKPNMIVLDQIRAVDKVRLHKKIAVADIQTIEKIKDILNEMLVK
jgi:mRNA interferase MazF